MGSFPAGAKLRAKVMGMILLAAFLILYGLAGLGVPLGIIVPIVALLAGVVVGYECAVARGRVKPL